MMQESIRMKEETVTMQSSTQALQQFKRALAQVYQQWRDKQWEMMNIKLELPLFDAPV